MARSVFLSLLIVSVVVGSPACRGGGEGDGDSDVDTDSDADGDGDAGRDSEADADGDAGTGNSLGGSLGDYYDLTFDRVRARQFLSSRQLLVEYVRGSDATEEKPIVLTMAPTPDGPGTFDETEINIGSSLQPTSPVLPDLASVTVELSAFTAGAEGSLVEGSLGATFVNSGTGDTFTLDGRFSGLLEVVE